MSESEMHSRACEKLQKELEMALQKRKMLIQLGLKDE